MPRSAFEVAGRLLSEPGDQMEEILVHEFVGDDDQPSGIDRAYASCLERFQSAEAELLARFGKPALRGEEDDGGIPLNGLLRFAQWTLGDRILWLALAHEDRACPVVLVVGVDG